MCATATGATGVLIERVAHAYVGVTHSHSPQNVTHGFLPSVVVPGCGFFLPVSINQSTKTSERHTSTREATSQRNHTGSKPRDAKRRRLGGLRASRASASLRDSL